MIYLKDYVYPHKFPLDKKLWYPSVSAVNLGQNNHLAFSFYKGMRIFCAEERQMYEWKPVVAGDSTLLNANFTYPAGSPAVNGVVYEGSTYNFVRILEAENLDLSDFLTPGDIRDFITLNDLTTYEVKNIHSDEIGNVYKNETYNASTKTKTFNFKKYIKSDISNN